jgi:cytochrome c biogenesis protein CcmG/thiol:disulfide interchange protein DsbE
MTRSIVVSRRLGYLLPIAVFGVIAAYFVGGLVSGRDPRAIPSVMIDQPVPEFALSPIDGMEGLGLSSADLRTGEIILVNFFATWCVPCRLEHPFLVDLAARDKVRLFGVNYKNEPAAARTWLADVGNPYGRIGADTTGRVGIDWGVYGLPETFIIDGNGRIRYRQLGPIDQRTLDRTIRPLIRELSK